MTAWDACPDGRRGASVQLVTNVPRDLQARMRRMLADPTAELLLGCGNGRAACAFADVGGRRRELEDEREGRAVTSIERDGRPLAAIVHDPARLDEPELVEHVATVVGLEVERE